MYVCIVAESSPVKRPLNKGRPISNTNNTLTNKRTAVNTKDTVKSSVHGMYVPVLCMCDTYSIW